MLTKAVMLEQIEDRLGLIGPPDTRWMRGEGGSICFKVAGDYMVAYLVSGEQRYGVTFSAMDSEDNLKRAVIRGLNSLNNQKIEHD
jgi:hypothetical protein